jgi:hypothetical protein
MRDLDGIDLPAEIRSSGSASTQINGAAECNVHHAPLGDSNSETHAASRDPHRRDFMAESAKSTKGSCHQCLMDSSGAWGTECRTRSCVAEW